MCTRKLQAICRAGAAMEEAMDPCTPGGELLRPCPPRGPGEESCCQQRCGKPASPLHGLSALTSSPSANTLPSFRAGQTDGQTQSRRPRSASFLNRDAESVTSVAGSGGNKPLPAHLSSRVGVRRGFKPNQRCAGGHQTSPRLPEELLYSVSHLTHRETLPAAPRCPRPGTPASAGRGRRGGPRAGRAAARGGGRGAHQNHSLPKLGTENTPQWMKTPNFASSNQPGSGRASSESQVGS